MLGTKALGHHNLTKELLGCDTYRVLAGYKKISRIKDKCEIYSSVLSRTPNGTLPDYNPSAELMLSFSISYTSF
jgi:hypothetical protein